jgi:ketosteroid isomerase-like protein
MQTLGSLYTDDVVQSMPGNNQLAGEHKGRDNVLALYGKIFELSGGTFAIDLESVEAKGDKVVARHGTKGERDGKTLADIETIEFTFDGDKISRLDLTSDNDAARDAFWG